jgi:hypothetical protein
LGERWLCKPEVIGSIPISSTKFRFGRLQAVRTLADHPPLLIENPKLLERSVIGHF